MEKLIKYKKKITIWFWLLWAISILSVWLILPKFSELDWFQNVEIGFIILSAFGFPIIGLILLALLSENDPNKKVSAERQKRVQKENELKDKTINEEKNRKEFEKYKIKEIGKWFIAPGLIFFILGIYFLWDWHANGQANWYLGSIVILSLITFYATDVENNWKKRLECKRELFNGDEKFSADKYNWGYVYTDKLFEYYFYKAAKIISILISISAVVAVCLIAFAWVTSITITPIEGLGIILIIGIWIIVSKLDEIKNQIRR